jgi:hypothetical protein
MTLQQHRGYKKVSNIEILTIEKIDEYFEKFKNSQMRYKISGYLRIDRFGSWGKIPFAQ